MLVFHLFWWDIICRNGHMQNPNLLQFPYLYVYMLLDQGAWDKVIYSLISKHFWAYHQYIVVTFSSYVRQANIHVLANSHLKQGIWALNPGEDRCSISRSYVLMSQYFFLWSFLNYDQSLTYDFLWNRPLDQVKTINSTPIVMSFDYFLSIKLFNV